MNSYRIKQLILLFIFLFSINGLLTSVNPLSRTFREEFTKVQSKNFASERVLTSINSTSLVDFVDTLLDEEMLDTFRIPGLVVSFVQNNETLFIKGFGQANISSSEFINPNNTIFRAGSVSKSFVATAVMQLYEKGLVELHTDINNYLPNFKFPETYPSRPITLHHLLTHTAGLDEVWNVTMFGNSSYRFEEFLVSNLPKRIYPPGEVFCYSNYGYALAGYLVGAITNSSFEQYVQSNIFDPLGMNSSGFEQPITPQHLQDFAQGYFLEDNELKPMELCYFMAYPAGSLYTTAQDMTKFITAHLNQGEYNHSRILNSSTIQLMQKLQFTHHPQLGGYCYGFYEYIDHIAQNITAIHHAGDLYGFASELVLFPELRLGFFLSSNGVSTGLREVFLATFYDTFFPTPPPIPIPTQDFLDRKHLFEGIYWYNRYPHEKYEQGEYSDSIPYSSIELSVDESAETLVTTIREKGEGYSLAWIEIEPFLFQYPGSDTKLALILVEGQVQYIATGLAIYERQWIDYTSITLTSSLTTSIETTTTKSNFPEFIFVFSVFFSFIFYRKRRNSWKKRS
jgi:CubicO group peptidase (beta-lactamase class C family)